ncbi:MAG: WecB/TagA/CpsF family glycosyltransferase [Leptolyngbyaceae cyanobacterium CSU_1_4]|nr:WecB/TagA/CpsF family glycosyltransferase [Leptolyngbyaceae cyanobacterium CSU_1_4]
MSRVKVLNAVIDDVSMAELLESLTRGVVFTPNVDHLVKLQSDQEFFEAYHSADFKTCDSKILFYVSRLLGMPLKEKISGSDLFPAFYWHHRHNPDIKIFLLGAREGVAAEAQRLINAKTGRNIIVEVHSPSFGFEQDEEECLRIIDMINQSDANVLAVGVGAPKQEKFIYKYKSKFKKIKIFMAVGATLDFEAGNIKRSPKWVSEMGLEWLYRLLSEPRRLWKRYLLEGPQFFWLAILQKLNLYTDPFKEVEASLKNKGNYNPLSKLMDI